MSVYCTFILICAFALLWAWEWAFFFLESRKSTDIFWFNWTFIDLSLYSDHFFFVFFFFFFQALMLSLSKMRIIKRTQKIFFIFFCHALMFAVISTTNHSKSHTQITLSSFISLSVTVTIFLLTMNKLLHVQTLCMFFFLSIFRFRFLCHYDIMSVWNFS